MAGFDQLSGLDCAFLFMESPETPMHVGGVYLFSPRESGEDFDLKALKSFLEKRLHLAKPFLKKVHRVPLDLDYPYWIDAEDFDIDRHLTNLATETVHGWRHLTEIASRFFAEAVDLDNPLWAFGLIPDLKGVDALPDGGFALMTKFHHAAIDGASGVDIQRAMFALSAAPPSSAPSIEHQPIQPAPKPNMAQKLITGQENAIVMPAKMANAYARLAVGFTDLFQSITKGTVQMPPMNPQSTRFNTNIDASRQFGAASIELETIKAIRSSYPAVTINDVILAIVGGGLRSYLDAKGDETEALLCAMVPISVRKERSAEATGNDVANMSVSIGSHIADPVHRLIHVHEHAVQAKAAVAAVGAENISEASKYTPPWMAGPMLRGFSQIGVGPAGTIGSNTTVTNVPGPPVPVYLEGARLERQYNMAPLMHGMGLVHTVYSYCGVVSIAFNACRKMLPDAEFYEQCLAQASADLAQAADASGN